MQDKVIGTGMLSFFALGGDKAPDKKVDEEVKDRESATTEVNAHERNNREGNL